MVQRSRFLRRAAGTKRQVPPARLEEEVAALAWGIAHPARVAILRLLFARGGCICGDIVDQIPLAQATVSQHLKVLRETGWIEGEIDGPRVCYCPAAGTSERLKQRLQAFKPNERR